MEFTVAGRRRRRARRDDARAARRRAVGARARRTVDARGRCELARAVPALLARARASAACRSASSRRTRRRSRTCSCRSPGGSLRDAVRAERRRTAARRQRCASSLAQLTLVRFREFIREPEAVFWTFVFPVVLAIGLGIAFRNKPAETLTRRRRARRRPRRTRSRRGSARAGGLRVDGCSTATAAAHALRTGEVALVASPRGAADRGVPRSTTRGPRDARRASSWTTPCSARRGGAIRCRRRSARCARRARATSTSSSPACSA